MPIPLGILDFPSGAGATAYDLLETQVLTSSASSILFTGLGSYTDYKHLEIRGWMQGTASTSLSLRLNGDIGNNYAYHTMDGYSGSVRTYSSGGTNFMFAGNFHASTSAFFAPSIITFLDFSDTNKTTTMRYFAGKETGNYTDTQVFVGSSGWFNTAAVTSILLYPASGSFTTNSRLSLYGIK